MQTINKAGLDLIKGFEKFIPFAYDDAVHPARPIDVGEHVRGTLTIGYGHTGPDVKSYMKCDEAQAIDWLNDDLSGTEQAVSAIVEVPLNENQYAALIAFAFNVGNSNFRSSTLCTLVNKKDFDGAAEQFGKWTFTHIDGEKVRSAGLVRRRAAEAELFSRPVADAEDKPRVEPQATAVAVPAPPPKPSAQNATTASGMSLAGIGATVSPIADQLSDLAKYSSVIGLAAAVLVGIGLAIAVYGYLRAHKQGFAT